ncbi:MAG TPA: phosphatase PAP2 family protein [Povalibacter sp.]|nr:phosphatase PAP2 family protein [Povalibacter sp.]
MTPTQYWWRAMRWPLAVFLLAATLLAFTNLDEFVARTLFFDTPHMRWVGGGNWWINEVIHTGGRWAIRGIIVATLGLWIATFRADSLLKYRRPAAYFVISMVLTVGAVGLLKQFTNVDCPWDLQAFGGQFPYVHLFAHRPAGLRIARCFPAAHASSGYALMTLYFVGLAFGRRWARIGLIVGVVAGLLFGLAQQSRGAHFVSHDLWSAMFAWCIPLSVYCFGFRCSLLQSKRVAYRSDIVAVPAGRT